MDPQKRAPRRRLCLANCWQHVSARTLQGRFAFVPKDADFAARAWGIVGRAQQRYKVELSAFVLLSNHFHATVRSAAPGAISLFIQFVKSNLARLSHEYYGTSGTLWDQPFSNTNLLDVESELHWMQYILSHGVKEGLVADPAHWPGANCVAAVCDDVPIRAVWLDRKAWAQAPGTPKTQHFKPVPIVLVPMTMTDPSAWRKRCQVFREQIIEDHAQKNFMGAEAVRTFEATHIPETVKKSRRRLFDASGPLKKELLKAAYEAHRNGIGASLHAIATLVRDGCKGVCQPSGYQWTAQIACTLKEVAQEAMVTAV